MSKHLSRVDIIPGPVSLILNELITEICMQIYFALIMILIIKSGHNFAHVMTAELSWQVQNCDLI